MVIDFNIQNQSVQSQSSSVGFSSLTTQAKGTLMGQNVFMPDDPMSLLADCAEELTFAVDTTEDFELQERKEKEVMELKDSDIIKRYSKILQQSDKAKKFIDLKNAILSMKGMLNLQTLLQLARNLSENSAETYAFLKQAHDDFKNDHADPSLLKILEETLDTLELHEKGKIITSIQVELTKAEDNRFNALQEAQSLYTTSVSEFLAPKEVYAYINQHYSGKIDLALDFLYKTLANDLAADVSSSDKVKLQSVSTSLGELRAFQSAHVLCDKFITRLNEVYGITTCPYSGFQILGKLLDMKEESFLSSSSIDKIAADSHLANPEQEVFFLQELQTMARQLSLTIFNNGQERAKVVDAIQMSVDQAIEREDEWLYQMENQ